MNNKENVLLADCEKSEVSSLLRGLNISKIKQYVCVSRIANGKRTGKISELKRYIQYCITPWNIFVHRKEYEIVAGWQQFYALTFCFYCALFKVKKCNTVLAINFTYKSKGAGIVGQIYEWFMSNCMMSGYLDYIHVPSNDYANIISSRFNYPREKIIVSPFGIDDIYSTWVNSPCPDGYKKNGYAMAIGRSNRDYDFLIDAWKNINYPLVIISDTYKTNIETISTNVKLIDNVSGDKQYPWMANANMVILPIKDGRICSGDTVLLTAMSFAKNVIITIPSTLGEMYIKNGENGYLVKKEKDEFCKLINSIISEHVKDISKQARKSYLKEFTRESMGRKIADVLNQD